MQRHAFVCASSQGLGLASARALAEDGHAVTLTGRDRAKVEGAAQRLGRDLGIQATGLAADLTDLPGIPGVLERATAGSGPIDVLVLNSGGPPPGAFASLAPEAWARGYDLVLRSAIALIQGVLPSMRARKYGRIVAITSVAAREPIPSLTTSNTFRAGLLGLLKSLSREVAKDGVLVNAVLPGYTATERLTELVDDTARREGTTREAVLARFESEIPAGRLGRPEELGAVVAFLASERASFVTGTAIPVDGGWMRGS